MTAKPKQKTKTAAKSAPRLDPSARITWLDRDNPYREGSGAHQRTELAKKHHGRTVEAFIKAGGVVRTLRTLTRMRLARVG